MAAEVPAPSYPTPDYGSFAAILGNLANTYRSGEMQNLDLDARKAFMDGFPTNDQGQPDWAKALQVYAQKGGDIRNTYNLAELAATQGQQQQLQQTMSSVLGGGMGGGALRSTGNIPPASASRGQPSMSGGEGGGYAEPVAKGVQPPRNAGFNDSIQDLQEDAEENEGISTKMISGQRDAATQAKLRANMEAGRAGKPLPYPELGAVAVAAEPGTSPHEAGVAADVVAGGGQQQRLIEMAREPWRGIKPGADFGDPNHFQAADAAPSRLEQGKQPFAATPLVPMPPLISGTKNAQESIAKIDELTLKLAENPNTPPTLIKALEARKQEFIDATTPKEVIPGRTFVDPQTRQTVYTAPLAEGGLSPFAINDAAEIYLKTGEMPKNVGRGQQGPADIRAIQNRAAEIANERGITPEKLAETRQQYKGQQATIKEFDVGSAGKSVGSYNTLVSHLGTLRNAAAALGNGDTRLFNAARQEWKLQTGDPAPTNFDGVRELVGDELVKAITGGAGALGDREAIKKTISSANSPEQLSALLGQYQELAAGQLKTFRRRYEAGTGLKDFDKFLAPETQALFGNGGEGANSPKAAKTAEKGLPPGQYDYDPATGEMKLRQ